jgi:hypothetical protein
MSGVLSFDQFIGGPDQLQIESVFPSTQRSLVYNFGQDITGWDFTVDYQTIVVDQIKFNRLTGAPNFSDSKVIGTFPSAEITGALGPTVLDASIGTVQINFPAGLYTGPIIPDARQNVPITVIGITWADTSTPPQVNTHRWSLIQSYEPGVPAGDPTTDPAYTALTLG